MSRTTPPCKKLPRTQVTLPMIPEYPRHSIVATALPPEEVENQNPSRDTNKNRATFTPTDTYLKASPGISIPTVIAELIMLRTILWILFLLRKPKSPSLWSDTHHHRDRKSVV